MIYFFHELISFLNIKKSWKSKRLFKIDPVYRNNLHHMIQVSFDDIDALFRPSTDRLGGKEVWRPTTFHNTRLYFAFSQ